MNPNPNPPTQTRSRTVVLTGLGLALVMGVFLSPFASKHPDGLDRVSQDLKFDTKAQGSPPAQNLPFYAIFNEYALRGVPEAIATPLAGLAGTLATFGLAWGIGKLAIRRHASTPDQFPPSDNL